MFGLAGMGTLCSILGLISFIPIAVMFKDLLRITQTLVGALESVRIYKQLIYNINGHQLYQGI